MSYIAIDKAYIENRIAELKRLKIGAFELEDILSKGVEIPIGIQQLLDACIELPDKMV